MRSDSRSSGQISGHIWSRSPRTGLTPRAIVLAMAGQGGRRRGQRRARTRAAPPGRNAGASPTARPNDRHGNRPLRQRVRPRPDGRIHAEATLWRQVRPGSAGTDLLAYVLSPAALPARIEHGTSRRPSGVLFDTMSRLNKLANNAAIYFGLTDDAGSSRASGEHSSWVDVFLRVVPPLFVLGLLRRVLRVDDFAGYVIQLGLVIVLGVAWSGVLLLTGGYRRNAR
jgi:hypothetical protein